MGLDMYLEEEVFVGAQYEHRNITGNIDLYQEGTPIDIPLHLVSSIMLRRGYWRKANAIHKWFVNNVQDGEDHCQRSYVSYEALQLLRTTCNAIVQLSKDTSNPEAWQQLAEETLPSESGFFFGSTEYDEYYLQDLTDTIEIIDNCPANSTFYYQASW